MGVARPRGSRQVHPLHDGKTTQQITGADPLFAMLRSQATEVSFRKLCPEVPNTTYLTHGIHSYPAKFIPQIPRHFIKQTTQIGDTVLDPFAGSGTALVESTLLSRNSVGVDINPLAPLLWDVKTNYEQDVTAWRFELSGFFSYLKRTKQALPPKVPSLTKWFEPAPLKDLSRIFTAIRKYPFSTERLRTFMLVCASSTVRQVSLADPKVSKPFISRHRRELLARGPVNWRTPSVFAAQVEKYLRRVSAFYNVMKSEIARSGMQPAVTTLFPEDARTLPSLASHSVDAAVTSPPYVNAQEYFRTVKLELFWLGFADERRVIDLDRQVLGTEKVHSDEPPAFIETGVRALDEGLRRVFDIDRWRWQVAFNYFDGLRAHFRRMAEIIRPHGRYGFLIGDNTIRKVPLPVHVGIIQIAEDEGFSCVDKVFDRIVSRSLTPNRNISAGLIDVEWFLTFIPN